MGFVPENLSSPSVLVGFVPENLSSPSALVGFVPENLSLLLGFSVVRSSEPELTPRF